MVVYWDAGVDVVAVVFVLLVESVTVGARELLEKDDGSTQCLWESAMFTE